jgi:hypothetical protein
MPFTRVPRKILTCLADSPPQINWGRTLKKALLSIDLPTEFVKWRETPADRNQGRAVCGSKIPSATKETPTYSRKSELSSDTALYPHKYKNLLGNFRLATGTNKNRESTYS